MRVAGILHRMCGWVCCECVSVCVRARARAGGVHVCVRTSAPLYALFIQGIGLGRPVALQRRISLTVCRMCMGVWEG